MKDRILDWLSWTLTLRSFGSSWFKAIFCHKTLLDGDRAEKWLAEKDKNRQVRNE